MSIRKNCPKCGSRPEWLSTTDQWRWYCPDCDIRFNDEGKVLHETEDPREHDHRKER